MRELLSERMGVVAPLQRLVWITKHPQSPRGKASAHHPGVRPDAQGQGAVLLGVVESDRLLEVCSASGQISPIEQGGSHRPMCLQEKGRVLRTLGQVEKLFPQLLRRL